MKRVAYLCTAFIIIYTKLHMEYRNLGKTGLKVSALSFGASSLGGVFHSIDEGRAVDTVAVALDGGMNLIDVSPYYGHYRA